MSAFGDERTAHGAVDPSSLGSGSGTSVADALFTALAHASGDVDEDLPLLLQVIAESLSFDVATIWWWDPGEGLLRCRHAWQAPSAGCGEFLELAGRTVLAPGEPIPGSVFQEGEAMWISDIEHYPNLRRGEAARAVGLRSGVAFPIQASDGTVGVFELFSLAPRQDDRPLLDAVATAAAHLGDFVERLHVHAERDHLLVELGAAHRRQRFLLDANQALATSQGLDATIEKLSRVAVPALGDLLLIDVVTDTGRVERLSAYHADPARAALMAELRYYPPRLDGDHPAAIAIRTGRSNVATEFPGDFPASTTQDDHHRDIVERLGFTSYMCTPLLSEERSIGALTVVSAGSGRHFGDGDLQLVMELAGQVASVIERERRFDDQRHVAQVIQRSMLPGIGPPTGLEVAVRYRVSGAETEVGGDFYDVVELDSRKIALVIGDVEGHDLTAVTVMAKARSALHAVLQSVPDLGDALGAIDRFVAEQPEGRFVTVCVAVLDRATGDVELGLSGHPAPLRLGDVVDVLAGTPGPPAGAAGDLGCPRPATTRSHLPIGAGLMLYTDGLVETASGGPEARLPALLGALGRHHGAPIERACDAVIDETLAGSVPTDDIAVLWVIRRGDGPG